MKSLWWLLILVPCACQHLDCVPFDLEQEDVAAMFVTDRECGNYIGFGPWQQGLYQHLGLDLGVRGTRFLLPSPSGSCSRTSDLISVVNGGTIEVNIYLEMAESSAGVGFVNILVNRYTSGTMLGMNFLTSITDGNGWHTVTISMDDDADDAYIVIAGNVPEGSLLLVDSFRYFDDVSNAEVCQIYPFINYPPESSEETTDALPESSEQATDPTPVSTTEVTAPSLESSEITEPIPESTDAPPEEDTEEGIDTATESTGEVTDRPLDSSEEVTGTQIESTEEVTDSPLESTDEVTDPPPENTEEVTDVTPESTEEVTDTLPESTEEVTDPPPGITEEMTDYPPESIDEVTEVPPESTDSVPESTEQATEHAPDTSENQSTEHSGEDFPIVQPIISPFWNPVTITGTVVFIIILMFVVGIIAYEFGVKKARKEMPPPSLLLLGENFPVPSIMPRVTKIYNNSHASLNYGVDGFETSKDRSNFSNGSSGWQRNPL